MKLKKGFFFSLFVITALALVVFTFKTNVELKEEQRVEVFKTRVDTTNQFLDDMEKDIERAIYVSAFRAFLAMDEYIHKKEEYIDNVSTRLPELMINGTIKGLQMNSTNSSTFGKWIQGIQELSNRYNINITFKDTQIEVYQFSPWTIDISFISNVSVKDYEDIVSWNYTIAKSTIINISEAHFADPVYFMGSITNYEEGTPLINTIQQTPYEYLWKNDSSAPYSVNITNLQDHVTRQLYINNTGAPSYIMRLEGHTNCSAEYTTQCRESGIESLVNVLDMSTFWKYNKAGESDKEPCVADYQFFYEGCSPKADKNNVINMDKNFRLDRNHLGLYNLTSINGTG
jgi:hypothetical protein